MASKAHNIVYTERSGNSTFILKYVNTIFRLTVSPDMAWRQNSVARPEAGRGSVRWVKESSDVSLTWMIWETKNGQQARRSRKTKKQIAFVTSSRFVSSATRMTAWRPKVTNRQTNKQKKTLFCCNIWSEGKVDLAEGESRCLCDCYCYICFWDDADQEFLFMCNLSTQ